MDNFTLITWKILLPQFYTSDHILFGSTSQMFIKYIAGKAYELDKNELLKDHLENIYKNLTCIFEGIGLIPAWQLGEQWIVYQTCHWISNRNIDNIQITEVEIQI